MRFHRRLHGNDRRAARPSHVATGRLRDELHRDIAELRVRLEEVALRSEVHQRTGNADGVEAAVTEQRQMLHQFEHRLRHRIADAIVEREAEAVLDGAVVQLQRGGADTGEFGHRPVTPGRESRFVRAVAAAAAAALATMLMFSSGTTGLDPVSAPSDGPGHDASRTAERPGTAPAGEKPTADEFVVADVGVTDTPSFNERLQRRMASADGERDDPAFFEELLTRLFGAVASVTTTTLTQLDDGLTATELPSLGTGQGIDELTDEQLDLGDTPVDDSGEDSGLIADDNATAEPTEPGPPPEDSVDEDAEPVTDGSDGNEDDPAQDGSGDADEHDGFGGFSGGTSSSTSLSGAGLPVWD